MTGVVCVLGFGQLTTLKSPLPQHCLMMTTMSGCCDNDFRLNVNRDGRVEGGTGVEKRMKGGWCEWDANMPLLLLNQ